MRFALLTAVALLALVRSAPAQPASQPDAIDLFVLNLEQAGAAGHSAKVLALAYPGADDSGLEEFAYSIVPAPDRIVIKERDRTALEDGTQRLLLEVFKERGMEGLISTWRVDLKNAPDSGSQDRPPASPVWRVAGMERVSVVSGIYRLSLDVSRQFEVDDLTVTAPDLALHLPKGTAFLSDTPEGTTAVVLLGRGRMQLAPRDPAEQTQLRIFAGSEAFDSEFEAAFIRVRPAEFAARFPVRSMVPREVSASDARRAMEIFQKFVGRTLQLNLSDISRDTWSIVPSTGDLIAEVQTRRHGSLTYARTWSESEDVSLFDRQRRRNIAVYASEEKLAARGRFYSEDDLLEYDILDYDINTSFDPERLWVSGNARVKMRVRSLQLMTLTMRLAESLVVRGVYSPEFGRLLHLRVVGQHSLIVNLPSPVARDSEINLSIIYAGRVPPQELDREAIAVTQDQDTIQIPLEPRFIYSNRSYWYPQGTVTDYATARLRISVPREFDAVATGMPAVNAAETVAPDRKLFLFESDRPVRYIGCVISRFATVTTADLRLDTSDVHVVAETESETALDANTPPTQPLAGRHDGLSLIVQANPRQAGRARDLSQQSTEIIQFYASIVGGVPYPSLTLAVTESDLPGGHSPPYFVILNQPMPTRDLTWRNDPVAFDSYPTFFLAHELAHQWWGQAVGWKNYHEQWISEGISQYFAILFAEKERGSDLMLNLLRQMRKTGMEASDQGPIYLGYRLGHIRRDSRVFRALVYNKAAMVMHMLRRLVGDEAFFTGLRDFYTGWRFRKAGTDDFRMVMEEASKRDLSAFFEAWIYGASIPRLRFSEKRTGQTAVLRFEHLGEVVPVPVTATVFYADAQTQQIVIPVTERVVERKIKLAGTLRKIEVNDDNAALAEIAR
jgi:hypothetical protein